MDNWMAVMGLDVGYREVDGRDLYVSLQTRTQTTHNHARTPAEAALAQEALGDGVEGDELQPALALVGGIVPHLQRHLCVGWVLVGDGWEEVRGG